MGKAIQNHFSCGTSFIFAWEEIFKIFIKWFFKVTQQSEFIQIAKLLGEVPLETRKVGRISVVDSSGPIFPTIQWLEVQTDWQGQLQGLRDCGNHLFSALLKVCSQIPLLTCVCPQQRTSDLHNLDWQPTNHFQCLCKKLFFSLLCWWSF